MAIRNRTRDLYNEFDTSSPFFEGLSKGSSVGTKLMEGIIAAAQEKRKAAADDRRMGLEEMFLPSQLGQAEATTDLTRTRADVAKGEAPFRRRLLELDAQGKGYSVGAMPEQYRQAAEMGQTELEKRKYEFSNMPEDRLLAQAAAKAQLGQAEATTDLTRTRAGLAKEMQPYQVSQAASGALGSRLRAEALPEQISQAARMGRAGLSRAEFDVGNLEDDRTRAIALSDFERTQKKEYLDLAKDYSDQAKYKATPEYFELMARVNRANTQEERNAALEDREFAYASWLARENIVDEETGIVQTIEHPPTIDHITKARAFYAFSEGRDYGPGNYPTGARKQGREKEDAARAAALEAKIPGSKKGKGSKKTPTRTSRPPQPDAADSSWASKSPWDYISQAGEDIGKSAWGLGSGAVQAGYGALTNPMGQTASEIGKGLAEIPYNTGLAAKAAGKVVGAPYTYGYANPVRDFIASYGLNNRGSEMPQQQQEVTGLTPEMQREVEEILTNLGGTIPQTDAAGGVTGLRQPTQQEQMQAAIERAYNIPKELAGSVVDHLLGGRNRWR